MNSTASFTLRGGRIIDPANSRDEIADLAVVNGKIAEISATANRDESGPVLDISGLLVCPGLIDMHVHLREPGGSGAEDIESGTHAAARGGFTTVVAMPNTDPPLDSPAALEDLQYRCRERAKVRVLPCPALTLAQKGQTLTDFAALKAGGAAALSEDGQSLADTRLMREAMLQARNCGLVILDHCEDSGLAGNGAAHLGEIAARLGLPGKPRSSEDVVVARDVALAAETGCPVHIQHLSSFFSVALVKWARQQGVPVSAEVTPHHLLLTEDALLEHRANAKMNPPLRESRDRAALAAGLADGSIEAIATDHAPHDKAAKELPLATAANGVIGLETALALCLTELHHRRGLPLSRVLAKFTSGPRRILGLAQGTLSPGAPADIALIDPQREHTIKPDTMVSKARNTPFGGFECRGEVTAVYVAGRQVYPA